MRHKLSEGFDFGSDSFTVAGNGKAISRAHYPVKYFSIIVIGIGAPATAWTVVLEGSLDGIKYDTILTHNAGVGDSKILFSSSASPVLYFRSRLVSVTLAPATALSVLILGM